MIAKLFAVFGPLLLAACGIPEEDVKSEPLPAGQEPVDSTSLEHEAVEIDQKNSDQVLMALGSQYEYWHYWEIRRGLEQAGFEITLAAPTLEVLSGKDFEDSDNRPTMRADQLLGDTRISDFEAVILLNDWAGYLTGTYPEINEFLQSADQEDIIIAAFDYAPMILGEAGLLEGIKATAHISAHSVCESLERSYGAICTSATIEQDGNIITADGFNCPASWFARYVAEAVSIYSGR